MKTKTKMFKSNVPKPIKKLNWPQAKVRFPRLNPYGDADNDGLKNFRDCKPFDRFKKGRWHRDGEVLDDLALQFGTIKGMGTVRDVQKLEEDILNKSKREEDE